MTSKSKQHFQETEASAIYYFAATACSKRNSRQTTSITLPPSSNLSQYSQYFSPLYEQSTYLKMCDASTQEIRGANFAS